MKRQALPILGVAGLALLSVTAPAQAAADKMDICHAGKMISVSSNAGPNGVNGHAGHPNDIIEPNEFLPAGLNWVAGEGYKLCGVVVAPPVEEQPPAEQPPADQPPAEQPPAEQPPAEQPPAEQPPAEQPPAEQPTAQQPPAKQPVVVPEAPAAQTPVTQTPAGQVAAPQVAAAKVPAAAVSRGTNEGFNAQTAVGGTEGSTTWLAGLGVLLGAGAVVSVRRRSRTEPPTAR
ncbi:hypothetical protein [Pseudarthrobacter sulfonivorans]|uniref:hypothetical protein n=1 Tax=Pseudarthrobacter sulfonivorans TaxID=121292 RepID=UPI002102FEFC|nr:hypothetical protein [Pseudarthrobacter sulfonivorans]